MAFFISKLINKASIASRRKKWGYSNVKVITDVPYLDNGGDSHLLDVYSPKGEFDVLPTIVEVHGGAYIGCSKETNRQQGQYFAEKGFHVVNINYTLYPEGSIRNMVREVCCALKWIHDHADEYGFDTNNVFLTGDSAGGHIVLMTAAVLEDVEVGKAFGVPKIEQRVRGYAVTCPMAHFEELVNTKNRSLKIVEYALRKMLRDPEEMRLTDYRWFMHENYPEVLIVTTPTDTILYDHTKAIHTYMQQREIKHTYKEYCGEENVLEHVFNVTYPEYLESKACNADIATYFLEKVVNHST